MTADTSLIRLLAENADLRARLEEAEDTLSAIRRGDVDAIVVGHDIYTLDTANAANNRLRKDVLAQMEEAVLAFDDGDHIIFMNAAAERQYGESASAMLGRSQSQLYREVWPEEALRVACLRELRDKGAYRSRSVHVTRQGLAMHVESTVSSLRDALGAAMGHLCVIRDVSERVAAEQTLLSATIALARREREFSTLVENSPDIFARMDRELRHVYVSPVIERYTGMTPAEMLGKTNEDLGMPPYLCERWATALREVFATGQVGRLEFSFSTASQGERFFLSRLMPEFGDDGSVESVLSIASDMTEQAHVDAAFRESQARLQFTLESAKIGEWELDLATDSARTSLRHDRCFGYEQSVGEWGSRVMLAHVHPADRERIADELRKCEESHRELHFECRVRWPDGSTHWIEAHGVFYGGNHERGRLLGIVVDTTSRKQAEETLREGDRRKDEFLATLAHELRNPLAPIRNALQIMRLANDPSTQAHAQDIVERQLGQMVHLVDDLLDVSRISQGKLDLRLEHADVASVLQTAVETSRPLIDAGRHVLTLNLPEPGDLIVNADTTRLCQIVANLLNNAAKYTPEGGTIRLSGRRDGDDALIAVQDSGVGISHDMLPRVFDMFAQVDRSMSRAQGGLGIGLALVKSLVEMHGGQVEAHSDGPGRGCRFVVRLPLLPMASSKAAVEPPPALAHQDADGFRVLVVDDNVDSAESLCEVLRMYGYEVDVAHNGTRALEAARALKPQAMVLDIGLPGLSGHEVANRIRQESWGTDMLLIALSGWGQQEDRLKSRQAGFDVHFVKPVDLDKLIDVLSEAAQRSAVHLT